ncbi:MAG: hypothetical protein A3J59_01705 [Candidatus Buchananbacteria bacterium RIFCSPHIGHO2_02_FULL_56_16]|uniref:Bacterial sugar transferase domain-containing protein n=1 Tax=Candidatus Buchananbacteria bacterium RIFCSPHIGHO2_02_FULL_56_16 TaxID=1797542 RepID=A0A1G1YEB3_9BACT|nr:MAG: hypothetical protein A3J59_01705 [Candidatus Buchananbacteria bacterium RIFCSPHIGHO2_02_FULL_56_16]
MKRSELVFSAITVPLDYLAIVLAAVAAYFLRYLPAIQQIRPVVFNLPFRDFLPITGTVAVGWVAVFALTGLYAMGGTKKFTTELTKIFIACSAALALILAVMVFSRYLFDSRFIILATWGLTILFVSTERLIIRLFQRLAFKAGVGVHRVVIIGNGPVAQSLIDEFSTRPMLGYRVVVRHDAFDQPTAAALAEMVASDTFDEVIQVNPNLPASQTAELVNFVNEHHLTFKYTADLLGTHLTNLEVATIAGTPVVEVKKTRLDGWGRIYKRAFDLVASLVVVILTLPVMLIIALGIKFDSKGPIFFTYRRIGQFGKPFTYFKFRSMIKDAHRYRFDQQFLAAHQNLRAGSPMIKFKDDPRITRAGRFLRRWSLDELPEFFLVLIGKMSIVGPRPHEVEEVQRYQRHHRKLLTIKPGVTGSAQVSGRSDLDFEQEAQLDTSYIENWSLGLDLQIILKTPPAIIRRRTAA